jgi:Subtilisin inhibitor-like
MIRLALTAALGLVLCTTATASAAPTAPAAPAARASAPGGLLRVTYDDGHGGTVNRTLRCHPAGGTLRGAAQACARLDRLGGPLGPVPGRSMCSMIYGGPQTGRVTGVWHGRAVDESYSRGNGCQTQRWTRMLPVLPDVAARRSAW